MKNEKSVYDDFMEKGRGTVFHFPDYTDDSQDTFLSTPDFVALASLSPKDLVEYFDEMTRHVSERLIRQYVLDAVLGDGGSWSGVTEDEYDSMMAYVTAHNEPGNIEDALDRYGVITVRAVFKDELLYGDNTALDTLNNLSGVYDANEAFREHFLESLAHTKAVGLAFNVNARDLYEYRVGGCGLGESGRNLTISNFALLTNVGYVLLTGTRVNPASWGCEMEYRESDQNSSIVLEAAKLQ